MYNPKSTKAEEFISNEEIIKTIDFAKNNSNNKKLISEIIEEAKKEAGLTYKQAAILLLCEDKELNENIFELANKIKEDYYGNRIVLFAPLYLSNYCINGCIYCPYHAKNKHIPRKKMTQEEIINEVKALQDMGHKRLAIESGEDPVNNPIEYILESIDTIYSIKHKNGAIRRVNVNIAATTEENYKKLYNAKIGTYILFQETYKKETYEILHPTGPKHNYEYHTEAMDRAMRAGIEDVGLGVLFGLENYLYEFIALIMHAKHLESLYGIGPHTISVPRIRKADDIDPNQFVNAIDDNTFKKIIAVIRITLPYTGMIVSTRESKECRKEVLKLGISQISGGSKTSVGGYYKPEKEDSSQFEVNDNRTLDEVVNWLINLNYLPSFCTACYGSGRTGDRFMSICKNQQIHNYCLPNAIMTLKEYLLDYASEETKQAGEIFLKKEIEKINNIQRKSATIENIKRIESGIRDLKF